MTIASDYDSYDNYKKTRQQKRTEKQTKALELFHDNVFIRRPSGSGLVPIVISQRHLGPRGCQVKKKSRLGQHFRSNNLLGRVGGVMLSITRSWHPSFKLDRENGWGGKSNYHLWMS